MLAETLQERRELLSCQACPLHKERARTHGKVILGNGPVPADIVVIGMGGGVEESMSGRPFVGPAGLKLNQILQAAGIDPLSVYKTNIVLCRPPDNREPEPEEMEACAPFVLRELSRVKPRVLITAGKAATKWATGKAAITQVVGEILTATNIEGLQVVPIFHPAYLLRRNSPADENRTVDALRRAASLVGGTTIATSPGATTRTTIIRTLDEAKSFFEFLGRQPEVAFDFEATSLDVHTLKTLCVGFAWKPERAVVLPLRGQHAVEIWSDAEWLQLLVLLQRWAESDSLKIGANIIYDALCLRRMGITLRGPWFDVQAAQHLLDPTSDKSLDTLSWLVGMGGYKRPVYDAHTATKKALQKARDKQRRQQRRDEAALDQEDPIKTDVGYEAIPTEVLWPYNGADCDCTIRLKQLLAPKIVEQDMLPLFEKLIMPLHIALADVRWTGVAVDREYLQALRARYSDRLDEILCTMRRHEATKQAVRLLTAREQSRLTAKSRGRVVEGTKRTQRVAREVKAKQVLFNPDSRVHLSVLLFDVLKLSSGRRTKTGASTDKTVMAELAERHELPKLIQEYRQLAKLKSTYVDGLLKSSEVDGRAHTEYNINGTATGRLSSRAPNLQNIPGEMSGRKEEIRNIFVARPGYVLIEADYSQAEFRHWANYSQDPEMLAAIESGVDIHTENACLAYGIKPEEVTKQQRTFAKTLTFGAMYGRGTQSIAEQFDLPVEEAERIRETILSRFAVARKWLSDVVLEARQRGYTQTVFGRRRWLPDLRSSDLKARSAAEREAVNTPIQGGSGDMTNFALVRIYKAIHGGVVDPLAPKVWDADIVLQIHDSIVFEVRQDQAERFAKEVVQKCMTQPMPGITVPMAIELKQGTHWGTMSPVE